jgi:hypothetical protein
VATAGRPDLDGVEGVLTRQQTSSRTTRIWRSLEERLW